MTFIFCCYDYNDFQSLKERLNLENPSKIILCNIDEFLFNSFTNLGNDNEFDLLIDYINNKNISLDVITSGHLSTSPIDLSNKKYENVNILFYPTFYLRCTYYYTTFQSLELTKNSLTDIKYNFISLNGRIKLHRALMLDLLAKYNLIDKGAVSWHNVSYIPNNEYQYPWKYWTPSVLTLDGSYDNTGKINSEGNYTQWDVPDQYYQSFVQLVGESDVDYFILSEKTSAPLLQGKPFIVYGCKDFHKILKELGFLLYEEIFDYSFDQETNNDIRGELIVQNIDRICAMSKEQQYELYEKVQGKIAYNQEKAMEYVRNIPPKLLEALNEATLYPEKNKLFLGRFYELLSLKV